MVGSVRMRIYTYICSISPVSLEFCVFSWWMFLQGLLSEAASAPGRSSWSQPRRLLADGKLKPG